MPKLSRLVSSFYLMAVAFVSICAVARPSLAAEARFALVVGNDEYKDGHLATSANDAGLVADALQAAGFTVTGARNLDQATLRESIREFLGQVSAAGPDAVALVYLAGYGVQFEGDNYFIPVDAEIHRGVDVPLQAIRISDLTQPLASLPGHVKIVILDAARQNPFSGGDQPLASGLALVDPPPSLAVAFNAAPGTVAPLEQGPYGAYATALAEMIGTGGIGLDDLFARVRLRVSSQTQGAEVPWYAARINGPFFMTERVADAPPPPSVAPIAEIQHRPFHDYSSVDDAYAAAIALDTMDGYEQFLAIYPNTPYSQRIAAMLAVRREEIIWHRCVMADTPPAYWSYLRRYPDGPHAWDARRRLAFLSQPMGPPPDFAMYDFGVPPPPPAELAFIAAPVLMFVGAAFLPPPPPPVFFLPPRPVMFANLPPPPMPRERFFLPMPQATVMPAFVRPPPTVIVAPRPGMPGGPIGGPTGGPGGVRPGFNNVALPAAVNAHLTPANLGTPGAPGTPGSGGQPVNAPTHPTLAPLPHPGMAGAPPPPPGVHGPAPGLPAGTAGAPPPPPGVHGPAPGVPAGNAGVPPVMHGPNAGTTLPSASLHNGPTTGGNGTGNTGQPVNPSGPHPGGSNLEQQPHEPTPPPSAFVKPSTLPTTPPTSPPTMPHPMENLHGPNGESFSHGGPPPQVHEPSSPAAVRQPPPPPPPPQHPMAGNPPPPEHQAPHGGCPPGKSETPSGCK